MPRSCACCQGPVWSEIAIPIECSKLLIVVRTAEEWKVAQICGGEDVSICTSSRLCRRSVEGLTEPDNSTV